MARDRLLRSSRAQSATLSVVDGEWYESGPATAVAMRDVPVLCTVTSHASETRRCVVLGSGLMVMGPTPV